MLSVLRDLARHPDGMSTPELAGRHDAGGHPRARSLISFSKTMNSLEHHGLVRRSGTVRGQRGNPAVVWQVTDEGRAVAAAPSPQEARDAAARERAVRGERALAVIAGLRRAGYGPHTPYNIQVLYCLTLHAAGCTTRQIADLFGITHQGVNQRIARHPAAVQQREIRLGRAGSVSVIVSISQAAGLPGEKLTQVRRLVKDIEALGDCVIPEAHDLLDEAEHARHLTAAARAPR
jgi:hypothetical protein